MNIQDFTTHPFTKLDQDWAILTAGIEGDYNSMTVSWEAMGTIWGGAGHCLIIAEVTEIED